MVEWLTFCLRAWDRRGRKIAPAELIDRLLISPDDPVAVEYGPGVPRVRLLSVAKEDFAEVDTTTDAGRGRRRLRPPSATDWSGRPTGWTVSRSASSWNCERPVE